jgi:hypothetical protein
MRQLKFIFGLAFFLHSLSGCSQKFTSSDDGHVMFNCQVNECAKEHRSISTKYDSVTGLKLEIIRITSGLNFSMAGLTPAKVELIYKVHKGNVVLAEAASKTSQKRCIEKVHQRGYIEFNPKDHGFIVYKEGKKIYYNSDGQIQKEQLIDPIKDGSWGY